MPQAPWDPLFLQEYSSPEPGEELGVRPDFGNDVIGSAFYLENPTANMLRYIQRDRFKPDPMFNFSESLKRRKLWERADEFLGVESEAELDSLLMRKAEEERNRQTLMAAGWSGIAAVGLASVLDPTMFIPLVGPGRGVKAFAQSAGYAFLASGAEEAVLYSAQEDRTTGESLMNIGAGTVLGGILGGTLKNLMGRTAFEKMAADMVDIQSIRPIPPLPAIGSAGAKAAFEPVGGLYTGAAEGGLKGLFAPLSKAVNKLFAPISPVTRSVEQDVFPSAKTNTAQLSDAGLRLADPTGASMGVAGGTVESNVIAHMGRLFELDEAVTGSYKKYMGQEGVLGRPVATALGWFSGSHMSRRQFEEAIGKAMFDADTSATKEVAAAAAQIRKTVVEPFAKMMEEATIAGGGSLMPKKNLTGDKSWFFRMYNNDKIVADRPAWIDKLTGHFEVQLRDEFGAKVEKMREAQAKDAQRILDAELEAKEANVLLESFQQALKDNKAAIGPELQAVLDELRTLRTQRAKLKVAPSPSRVVDGQVVVGKGEAEAAAEQAAQKKAISERIKQLEELGGEAYKGYTMTKRQLKQRIRNLNRGIARFSERQQKKFDKIEVLEEKNLDKLEQAARKGQAFLNKADGMTVKALAEELRGLRDDFIETSVKFDKGEDRIRKLLTEENDPEFRQAMLEEQDLKQITTAEKLDRLARDLAEAERTGDPALSKQLVKEALSDILYKINLVNNRRGMRMQKLMEQAENLDPKIAKEWVEKIRARMPERVQSLKEFAMVRGLTNVDPVGGTAEFNQAARDMAERVTSKILGMNHGMPVFETTMPGLRGSEVERTFDIESKEIIDYLHTNVKEVLTAFIRKMAGDIELTKRFGDPAATKVFKELEDDYKARSAQIAEMKDKRGQPLSPVKQQKLQKELESHYNSIRKNFEGLVGRLRKTWGLPKDPDSWGYRAADAALHLNALRYMGGATITSLADASGAIKKYGFTKVYRAQMQAFVSGLKSMKMTAREAKLSGVGNDMIDHTRFYEASDIVNHILPRTAPERGLKYLSSRMGLVNLLDPWTAWMKQWTAATTNLHILDAVNNFLTAPAGSKKLARAIYDLQPLGITGEMAERIMKELQNGGGELIHGVWVPRTEVWQDLEVVQVYRQALARELNRTVVTPGIEKSLMADANIGGRVLFQFKSFALSATQKNLMAGLQERDMAYMSGVLISLAFGALSYYLYAKAVGGDTETEMMNAGLDKWADEAIGRSGDIGVIAEVQRIGEQLPWIRNVVNFSKTRSTRREGGDLADALGGPTVDLVWNKFGGVLTGMDEPTQHTLHLARQIVPFQNLFYLRQLLDMVEATTDLPRSRAQ